MAFVKEFKSEYSKTVKAAVFSTDKGGYMTKICKRERVPGTEPAEWRDSNMYFEDNLEAVEDVARQARTWIASLATGAEVVDAPPASSKKTDDFDSDDIPF